MGNRLPVGAYVCIFVSLTAVGLLGLWGTSWQVGLIKNAVLSGEINRLRAQAMRRAGHMEAMVRSQVGDVFEWERIRTETWLREYWADFGPTQPGQLYSAVVDRDGYVVLHSDPAFEGQQLGARWYDRVIAEVNEDVVETDGHVLAGGVPAYDTIVPLNVEDGGQMGSYHEGLSVSYVENKTNEIAGRIFRRSAMVNGGIIVIVLLSIVSLNYLILHSIALRKAMTKAFLERVAEVGQMAAGLAHEIRNPLHTIRLNLHTFNRARKDPSRLSPAEMDRMLRETNREIERIDRLMQELVDFAVTERVDSDRVDMAREAKNIAEFVSQELAAKQHAIRLILQSKPVFVRMNPGRMRQVLLNLIKNASDELPRGGQIELEVCARGSVAELYVRDDGPGVEPADRQRIFEPFFSRKEQGTGLGLALVRRFVEEAGGSIQLESNDHNGATFRVVLKHERKP
jgi:signal transduction histidine kinase